MSTRGGRTGPRPGRDANPSRFPERRIQYLRTPIGTTIHLYPSRPRPGQPDTTNQTRKSRRDRHGPICHDYIVSGAILAQANGRGIVLPGPRRRKRTGMENGARPKQPRGNRTAPAKQSRSHPEATATTARRGGSQQSPEAMTRENRPGAASPGKPAREKVGRSSGSEKQRSRKKARRPLSNWLISIGTTYTVIVMVVNSRPAEGAGRAGCRMSER